MPGGSLTGDCYPIMIRQGSISLVEYVSVFPSEFLGFHSSKRNYPPQNNCLQYGSKVKEEDRGFPVRYVDFHLALFLLCTVLCPNISREGIYRVLTDVAWLSNNGLTLNHTATLCSNPLPFLSLYLVKTTSWLSSWKLRCPFSQFCWALSTFQVENFCWRLLSS